MKHAAFALLILAAPVLADAPSPTLGEKGKLLYQADFSKPDAVKDWHISTGNASVSGNALHLSEKASDNHPGAFFHTMPLRDAVIEVEFEFQGAKILHVGFDPAKGELKKTGHLYSVVVTPRTWSIKEHRDKSDDNSKDIDRATGSLDLKPGQRYTLTLETKGPEAVAQLNGNTLKASVPHFAVKKPALKFRAMGDDGKEVVITAVRIYGYK